MKKDKQTSVDMRSIEKKYGKVKPATREDWIRWLGLDKTEEDLDRTDEDLDRWWMDE
ncbi:MAG: hypothetical protein LBO69_05185 [Ignavibacteria bacterium]|jgi:hypothetical protein|nr:hypothetical protein [Ignavibacteria bacterium]